MNTKVKEHVTQYQTQRKWSKHKIKCAKLNLIRCVPRLFRRKVLTIDMRQDLGIPNFEVGQLGDFYYYSPLTCYLFGVVDNSSEKLAIINAYVWREGDGDRVQTISHHVC